MDSCPEKGVVGLNSMVSKIKTGNFTVSAPGGRQPKVPREKNKKNMRIINENYK